MPMESHGQHCFAIAKDYLHNWVPNDMFGWRDRGGIAIRIGTELDSRCEVMKGPDCFTSGLKYPELPITKLECLPNLNIFVGSRRILSILKMILAKIF
jgi:hypothetical protein